MTTTVKIISLDYQDTLFQTNPTTFDDSNQHHATKMILFLMEWIKAQNNFAIIVTSHISAPIYNQLSKFECFNKNAQVRPEQTFTVIGCDKVSGFEMMKPHCHSLKLALDMLGINDNCNQEKIIKFCHIGDSLSKDMGFVANCNKHLKANYHPESSASGWWLNPNKILPAELRELVNTASSLDEVSKNIANF